MTIEESLKLIKGTNPKIQAFTAVFESESEAQVIDSQKRINAREALSQIDGFPLAIKDNISTTIGYTTASSQILKDYTAPYNATVIEKLNQAGAIMVGKTNLDEFAMGGSTENSAFGPTKNPHDLTRVAGGSSGGSAAAVAAGMVWGALGSDTGGSIRQPAAFCGIVGFKPSYGTVSRYGLLAMGSSLDVIGPMTKNVADAETLYKIIAGTDEHDSTSRDPKPLNSKLLKDRVFGIPEEFFGEGLDSQIRTQIETTIEKIKATGATIKSISLPSAPLSLAVYYIIMPVEVSSNMARYDGIKYGYSIERLDQATNLLDVYFKSRAEGFGAEVKRRIMLGTFASSAGYVDQYYAKAQKTRQLIKKEFEAVLNEVDIIITPVTPTLPWKLGEKSGDPLQMYLEDIYTVPANITGLPALSLPVGFVDHAGTKLPVGLQLIGRDLEDYTVLSVAEQIEGLL
jgi:aspartyl-tRNA(Asn)/glutamyl-tRNA(Gln) amidotransferase subunit A